MHQGDAQYQKIKPKRYYLNVYLLSLVFSLFYKSLELYS